MRNKMAVFLQVVTAVLGVSCGAQEISLESAPPVVVRTVPTAGAVDVDAGLAELRVVFSKDMQDGSWSWSTWGEDTFPETIDKPHYLEDRRTCVLPVKLEPGKFYATWLNSSKFTNFKDTSGNSAVPYLLTFRTAKPGGGPGAKPATTGSAAPAAELETEIAGLNDEQKLVLAWTDRQFRSFFDRRSFDGWSQAEREQLETRLVDQLQGPQTREYYQAINTLGAMKSQKAVQPLLAIAAERREKNCRDRWMAIRSLGLIGDRSAVPDLIHLVYHGNVNTRWWAQISLVRLTGVNFGKDWQRWGKWWTDQGGKPEFNTQLVVWYQGPEYTDAERLRETLNANDEKFFADLKK